MTPQFDVFLCHSSTDEPAVEILATKLIEAGIQPWLDKWYLVPGEPWQPAIEKALGQCSSCAVIVGPNGTGPWQHEEMQVAISRRVENPNDNFRVIPVLLPNTHREKANALPSFLRTTTLVQFKNSLDDADAFYRLLWGIRGEKPGEIPANIIHTAPRSQWVLVIDGTLDEQVKDRVEALAAHLRELLGDSHLTIKKIEAGSVRIIFEGTHEAFKQMVEMNKSGELPVFLGRRVENLQLDLPSVRDSSALRIKFRSIDQVTIVDLYGRITLGEGSVILREVTRDLLGKGHNKILLNLSDVTYIDSSGIGELVSAYTTVRNQGGELKLLRVSEKAQNLLGLTKLYHIHNDLFTALKGFDSMAK